MMAEFKKIFFVLLVAPILSGSAYYNTSGGSGNVNLFNGLIAAFSFTEGSGTTVADKSGQGNNLTLTNTTWSTSGHTGNAVSFNGTTSKAKSGTSASLSLSSGYTAMAWVYTTSNPGSGEHMVMGVSYSGSWPAAMECNGSSPIVCSCIVQTAGTWPGVDATVGISLNTWAHVACVYDGSKIRIYINGVLNNSATATGTIDSGSNWVEVGWDVNDNGDRYPGIIDDVRFYNRALSAAEITQAMNMPVAP